MAKNQAVGRSFKHTIYVERMINAGSDHGCVFAQLIQKLEKRVTRVRVLMKFDLFSTFFRS